MSTGIELKQTYTYEQIIEQSNARDLLDNGNPMQNIANQDVNTGSRAELFKRNQNQYTKALIARIRALEGTAV